MSKEIHHDFEQLKSGFNAGQLASNLGLELVNVEEKSISISLKVDARHLRPGGIMNGGISLLLIETTGSFSSYLLIEREKQNAFGIQVNANHIAVAKEGDVITAKSSAVHLGRTTHIWDVVIRNQSDKLVCSGRITMLVTER